MTEMSLQHAIDLLEAMALERERIYVQEAKSRGRKAFSCPEAVTLREAARVMRSSDQP